MTPDVARFSVEYYYRMQRERIRLVSQVKMAEKAGEPSQILRFLAAQSIKFEKRAGQALAMYASNHPIGVWMQSQVGIGPVLASGLLAHIDIHKAPTVGNILSFAGLVPGVKWGVGQKRPWNNSLKKLCWLIGESFVKVSGNERAYYGHLYRKYKTEEWVKNLRGDFSDQAQTIISERNFGEDTFALKWYSGAYKDADFGKAFITGIPADIVDGKSNGVQMLPPAHIHARSKRRAVKMFLAHLHEVWYEEVFKCKPPTPYPLAQLGHADYMAPPKEDYKFGDNIYSRHPNATNREVRDITQLAAQNTAPLADAPKPEA